MVLALHHELKEMKYIMALQQADLAAAATAILGIGPLVTQAVAAAAADNTLDITPVNDAIAQVVAQVNALIPAPVVTDPIIVTA